MSDIKPKQEVHRIPLKLQFFAEPPGGGDGTQPPAQTPPGGQAPPSDQGGQQAGQIDYAKIQQMLDGTLAVKEDAALKTYFKQQGLSQQEAESAMAAFKAEKAKNQPDINAMQEQVRQSQKEAQEARLQGMAAMTAVSMGLDAKTIPYVLKMADLGQAVGQDGKVNEETLKNALNKVLEDVPALKPQAKDVAGFQMGAPGGSQQQSPTEDALKKAFGL